MQLKLYRSKVYAVFIEDSIFSGPTSILDARSQITPSLFRLLEVGSLTFMRFHTF